ncbi:MAG: hypothetical protein KJ915_04520 [Candidatus Omnitrophica bacterium]|nr:hypothetical protein [Candidatus Omnitrophota bacterium]
MKIRLAQTSDDAQLRKLMHKTIMPGHIKIRYAREPNFFEGVKISGEPAQVIVADNDGEIMAVGCRSINTLYVNAEPQPVGYLSGLRLMENVQNRTVLVRGYSYLKRLHNDKKTKAYLTTIIQGNDKAIRILTSKRASLPAYISMGAYLTYVLPVGSRARNNSSEQGIDIISGEQIPVNELLTFLNKEGSRRQFFPECSENKNSLFKFIGRENILVARKDGKIKGMFAVWNQKKFKQHIVAGYTPAFKILRPFLNIGLKLKGCRPLPSKGEKLNSAVISLVCFQADDSHIFSLLLQRALSKAAENGLHQLIIGLHERDPLCLSMKKFFHTIYRSQLYLVYWEDGISFYNSLDKNKIPYLELGIL